MRAPTFKRGETGFTLVELLTVVAIIAIMAAVAIPNVMSYLRQYRIRGATQELSSALQRARTTAILKSSQWGVLLAIQNPTTYWIHIEDDQNVPRQGLPMTLDLDASAIDRAQSARYTLPAWVVFASAAECTPAYAPWPAFAPNDGAIRFNRMGLACDPGSSSACQAVTPLNGTLANLIQNAASYSMVCLRDTRSGLARRIRIERGGRVEEQR